MTHPTIALMECLRKPVWTWEGMWSPMVGVVAREPVAVEPEEQTGAGRSERTVERKNQRNGYRDPKWDTRSGTVSPKTPEVRTGQYCPSLLEPRRNAEGAMPSSHGAGMADNPGDVCGHGACE